MFMADDQSWRLTYEDIKDDPKDGKTIKQIHFL
jgi:hypothetical protein